MVWRGATGPRSARSARAIASWRRLSRNARSTRIPSTTPMSDRPGVSVVKPIARQPSWTSARSTRVRVSGSCSLNTQATRVFAYTLPLAAAYSSIEPCQSTWSSARFSTADDAGASPCVQCSWKLESSRASTSKPSGSRIASSTGVPTLPQATARRPSARRMASTIVTVVVLPFVPVRHTQSAVFRPARSRSRQASSTSDQIGRPAAWAAISSGWSGRQPGEVTTRSAAAPSTSGSACVAARSSRTSRTPTIRRVSARARFSGPSSPSTTTTAAPSSARVSATEKPVTPRPVTTTRRPAHPGASQDVRSAVRAVSARGRRTGAGAASDAGPVTGSPPRGRPGG